MALTDNFFILRQHVICGIVIHEIGIARKIYADDIPYLGRRIDQQVMLGVVRAGNGEDQPPAAVSIGFAAQADRAAVKAEGEPILDLAGYGVFLPRAIENQAVVFQYLLADFLV